MSVLLARRPNLPGAIHVANSDSPTWAASGQVCYRARQRSGDPRKVVLQRGTRDARGPGAAVSLGSGRSHGGGHIRGGVVGRALRWIFWPG